MTLEEYRTMISHRSINDSIIEEVSGILTIKTTKRVTGKGFKQQAEEEDEWVKIPIRNVGREYWLSRSGKIKRDTGKNSKGKDLGYGRLMQKPNKQGCITISYGEQRIRVNVKKIHEEYWPDNTESNNNNNNNKKINIKIKEA